MKIFKNEFYNEMATAIFILIICILSFSFGRIQKTREIAFNFKSTSAKIVKSSYMSKGSKYNEVEYEVKGKTIITSYYTAITYLEGMPIEIYYSNKNHNKIFFKDELFWFIFYIILNIFLFLLILLIIFYIYRSIYFYIKEKKE